MALHIPSWVVPVVAQVLLFALLTGMSASVDFELVKKRFQRRSGILAGLFCQFFLLPAAGLASAKAFDLPPVFGITLLAVTSSPGGAYSNWWCSLFNADLALSVAMTTMSTLVCIGMTPLNLYLYSKAAYGEAPSFDWLKMLSSIGVAVAALLFGLFLSWKFPRWRYRANVVGNLAGISLVVFSACVSSRSDPIWDKDATFYLSVSLPCIFGLVVSASFGFAFPWVSGPEAVAISVATCYQNTGVALAIALAIFDEEDRGKAAGVPLFYGVVQVVILPMFLLVCWKCGLTYAPADARLFRVIVGNFQPAFDDVKEAPPAKESPGQTPQEGVLSDEHPVTLSFQDEHPVEKISL